MPAMHAAGFKRLFAFFFLEKCPELAKEKIVYFSIPTLILRMKKKKE